MRTDGAGAPSLPGNLRAITVEKCGCRSTGPSATNSGPSGSSPEQSRKGTGAPCYLTADDTDDTDGRRRRGRGETLVLFIRVIRVIRGLKLRLRRSRSAQSAVTIS